jgi:F0F1-type ATP synthase membrane subunit c/vacuolar-type H+-ATPase subunit K
MNLNLWIGMAAAQKAAGSKGLKPADRQHRNLSPVAGLLFALLAGVGFLGVVFLILLASHN